MDVERGDTAIAPLTFRYVQQNPYYIHLTLQTFWHSFYHVDISLWASALTFCSEHFANPPLTLALTTLTPDQHPRWHCSDHVDTVASLLTLLRRCWHLVTSTCAAVRPACRSERTSRRRDSRSGAGRRSAASGRARPSAWPPPGPTAPRWLRGDTSPRSPPSPDREEDGDVTTIIIKMSLHTIMVIRTILAVEES